MSCARYRQLLSRYVDGEVTPRQRQELMAHIQGCRECATWLAKARQTDTLLKGLPEAVPSDWVRNAVLSTVKDHPTKIQPQASKRGLQPQPQRPVAHVGGLRLGAAGLLLRFDPSTRSVMLAAAASFMAMVSLAYWTGVLPPINGYNKLGFEFPSDNSRIVISSTPLSAVSLGENGVGGPVAVPNPVRILPTEGMAGVPTDSPLRVRFDQPMDRSSVESAMLIQPPIAGSFNWTADNEVSFVPGQPGLLRGVTYSATLSNTARSLAGTPLGKPLQWSFHTLAPHAVSPGLPSQAHVPLTGTLSIAFDTPMDKAGTADKVSLYSEGTNERLSATLIWSNDGRNLTVSPDAPLPEGTISLRVGEGALTGSGETLGKAYEFTYQATTPSPSLRLKQGRVRVVQAGEASTVEYSGTLEEAEAAGTPLGRVVVHAYKLSADSLSALKAQALPWPSQLPDRFTDNLEHVKTFRATSPEDTAWGDPITIEGLPAGIYLLRAEALTRGAMLTDWQLLIVADRNLAQARSVAPSAFWATDEAGQAWGGAEISLYAAEGSLLEKGTTTRDGLWAATAVNSTLAIAQDTGGHIAATTLEATTKPTNSRLDTLVASLRTDRAIYLPGQTINFRVLLHAPAEAAPATPSPEQDVTVQLRTPEDAPLATLTLRPDSVGGVGGLFPISSLARPGTYNLQVRAANIQRSFPVEIASPDKQGLSVYIVPAAEYTASESLLITRTVSVLGEGGAPAAGAILTATLGIAGDAWASQPLTATADQNGRAIFTLPTTRWTTAYNDPGLYIEVQASLADRAGNYIQYIDFAPEQASQAGLPQIVSPLMDVAANARSRRDGSIAVRIVELGATGVLTTGNVLVTGEALSGERFVQVVDLAGAGGDVTVKMGAQFAGGTVSIMRGGHSESRRMLLMPAQSPDLTLRVNGPNMAVAGAPMPLALSLRDAEGQGMQGVASVWLRPVSGDRSSEQTPDWDANVALQASTPVTATLSAPTEPGLWYVMVEAATPDGLYERAWSVVQVTPGLAVQLPSLKEAQAGKPQSVSVVLHNPTDLSVSTSMRLSAPDGIALLGAESQGVEIEAGGWRKLDWQYSALKGQTELKFDVTSANGISSTWRLPVQTVKSDLDNTSYAAGLLTGERDIAVHVPSGLSNGSVQLEIRASTSLLPALAGIAEGLPMPSDEPEQGVALAAARLSCAPVVAAAYRRVEGEDKAGLEQSGIARSLLLQDLYSAQHQDGGWGAEIAGTSDVAGTSHVLLAMRRAGLATSDTTGPSMQAAGIDQGVLNRGLEYLTVETARAISDHATPATLDERAHGMYVLSLYGLLKTEQVRPLMQYISRGATGARLSTSGQAWLALALWQAGDSGDALVILDGVTPTEVKEDSVALAPLLELSLSASASVRKATPGNAAIKGKRDAAGYDSLAREYAQALMETRHGLGWNNASATAGAVWSLSLYATQESLHLKRGTPDITINDRPVQLDQPPADGHAAISTEDTDTVSVLLSGDALQAGTNWLKLKAPGPDSSLYYSLTLKASK